MGRIPAGAYAPGTWVSTRGGAMDARIGTIGREPVAVPAGGGEARWWMGSPAVIRVTAAETGGR